MERKSYIVSQQFTKFFIPTILMTMALSMSIVIDGMIVGNILGPEALAAVKGGVAIKELNVGSMAHSEGKIVVNKAISMDTDDIKAFVELKKLGVAFDVRKVPADSRENMDDLLKKAAAGLR